MEAIVAPFRDFRLRLEDATAQELEAVSSLRESAEAAGDRAFVLLVLSGAVGIVMALAVSMLISRSILKPLSALEATAAAASNGDLTARAPATGPKELAHLGSVLNQMMAAVEHSTEELRGAYEELWARNQQLTHARAQAASDSLTGLRNHRKFHERIRELVLGAQENGASVGLIMLDVDNFKRVNDSLGHQAGDQALREIATTLGDIVDQEDAYRYGGDEFAILLPVFNQERAAKIAEGLLRAINRRTHREQVKVTVSLGVAAFPENATSADELIYRADMALNWAKSSGKSQVVEWDNRMGPPAKKSAPGYEPASGNSS
jgi:diguanylate cyclase (GGDEF)-like protein